MPQRAHRALASYVARLEQTLSLLGPLSVVARPVNMETGSIAVLSHDHQRATLLQDALARPIPLRNSNHHVDLILFISLTYRLIPEMDNQLSVMIQQTGYFHRICDCSGRPLLEFHYHPSGLSRNTEFHAHAPLAGSATLHVAGRPADVTREIFGHKLHIPTREMHAEDLVEILQDDFSVRLTESDPRRVARLLASNRAARRQTPS